MRVLIRADASVWIGSGHMMRCLVLGAELKRRGHEVIFACRKMKGDLISYAQSEGFNVLELEAVDQPRTPISDADYQGWLQKDVDEDALEFVQGAMTPDLVVVDHYALGSKWQSYVRSNLSCKIFAIDDLVRVHTADLILDQTLGRCSSEYKASARAAVLTGCKYALLKPDFGKLREKATKRDFDIEGRLSVLVSMGGVDSPNATLRVLQALEGKADFTVLLGANSPNYVAVKEWCLKRDNVTHVDFARDMASLMLAHDLSIGAPGTTSWERACMGLPSIIIPLAENQLDIARKLVEYKVAIEVSLDHIEVSIVKAFDLLRQDLSFYSNNGLKLCDGMGVERVAQVIEGIVNENCCDM